MIKVKGFQVAPAELEGCLLGMPEVADACVVAVPDDYNGEVPMAFVVLDAHVAEHVAMNPAEVEKVVDAIIKVRACYVHYLWNDSDNGTIVCGRQQGGI